MFRYPLHGDTVHVPSKVPVGLFFILRFVFWLGVLPPLLGGLPSENNW